MKMGRAGVTLVEVLIAVVLTTTIVASLSLLFPRVAKNVVRNRQRAVATNLASDLIETLKAQPYTTVEPTPAGDFQASTVNCDCQADDLFAMPYDTTIISSTTYRISTCVNYVVSAGSTWTPACPAGGDTGYKSILARIDWSQGADSYSTSQTTFKTRY